ncbi:MAG TPA: glycosyl hydrolase family 8 [Puia sp.]|nr:glycosyl hydrolase family 8 [Puia sp.]
MRITLFLLLLFKTVLTFSQTPEDEGFSSKGLSEIFRYVKEKKLNIHSLLIVRNKQIVLDAYFYPFRSDLRHDLASCTKSITSLLIGIAIDKGYIKNEDQLVSSFFPELNLTGKGFETLSIKDLLTMKSGLDCGFSNEDSLFNKLFPSNNWPKFIFDIPFVADPGQQFSYCSCNYYLLAEIIYRATGSSPEDFAKKYLFNDLGITSVYWSKNDHGINYGWGDLALKPLDLAKIGQLLLDGGKWNNKTIISAGWIKKAKSMNTVFPNGNGYGYGFWIDKDHACNMEGRGTQRVHIDSLHNIILVVTAGGLDDDDKEAIGHMIGNSIHSDKKLKSDPVAFNSLKKLELQAAKTVIDTPRYISTATEKGKLFNKTIIFPTNSLAIDTAEIIGEKGNLSLLVKQAGAGSGAGAGEQTIIYPLGFGAAYKFYQDAGTGHLYALRAYWKAANEFEIEFNMLSKINKYLIDFKLGDSGNEVSIKEGTHHINEVFPVTIQADLPSTARARHTTTRAQPPALPFPQHAAYAAGILPDTASRPQMDDAVRHFFTAWSARYLKRSPDGKGCYVSIKGNSNAEDCVSEAMGYGMMIEVLMADSANNDHNHALFDSLFDFYRAHPSRRDRPGSYRQVSSILMASAQKRHGLTVRDVDKTSAADGDIDIAFSLLLAARQWPSAGGAHYHEEAMRIIDSIFTQEIDTSFYTIIESNAIESDGSPDYHDFRTSDFIPSELRAFGEACRDPRWNRVVDSNYMRLAGLRDAFSPYRHLLADFYERVGAAYVPGRRRKDEIFPDAYYYNACRAPWRIGLDYLMSGDERSKDLLAPLNQWFIDTTHGDPARINAGYTLKAGVTPSPETDSLMLSFIAPLGVSAMADPAYHHWLNKIWALTAQAPLLPGGRFRDQDYGYYENTIKLLCMIILSGNYWSADTPVR